jgi:hypothetical protein
MKHLRKISLLTPQISFLTQKISEMFFEVFLRQNSSPPLKNKENSGGKKNYIKKMEVEGEHTLLQV